MVLSSCLERRVGWQCARSRWQARQGGAHRFVAFDQGGVCRGGAHRASQCKGCSGEAVVNLSQGERHANSGPTLGWPMGAIWNGCRLLTEAMAEQPEVLKSPEPAVFLQEFGDSSLNFSVMGWLDDPWDRMGIQSRVRRAIDLKFRENNVSIPFSAMCTFAPCLQRTPQELEASLGQSRLAEWLGCAC